ncbi:MAG TPA: ADOP family duplicated permease [Bryobacteraceae bacterium]|nr:ADOP family duplicated permease [Bryobacteraceae bacterium]
MNWHDLKLRVSALLFRRRTERDLDDELQFHLAMQARKNQAGPMSADDAGSKARTQFGKVEQVKEACRDARGLQRIEALLQDIRYSLRGLRSAPGFALTVILTIALGLGLNTALFTVFNVYVLRPLAVRDPAGLYEFTWNTRAAGRHRFTWQELRDFQEQNTAFSETMAYASLLTQMEGRAAFGHLVAGNYFSDLGIGAALGRPLLSRDDGAPGTGAVVVISFAAWGKRFGNDPNIVGRKLLVHGYPMQVVGVAQEGFSGLGAPADFWAPLSAAPLLMEGPNLFGATSGRGPRPQLIRIIGRLRPGTRLRQAEAILTTWARQMTSGAPDAEKATGAVLDSQATMVPASPEIVAAVAPIFVAFGLVLLIACGNVANMMLARGIARQREIGIRLSLGAGRGRLIQQLLTESMLLALPAAAAAFAVAKATIRLGESTILATLPRHYLDLITIPPLDPDWRVFAFMLAAAVASALVFGLAPAVQITRPNVVQAARGEFSADLRPMRLRSALVIGQISFSALIVICAAILLRANNRLVNIDIGLEAHGVLEMEVQGKSRSAVLERLASEPVVQSIAGASKVPFQGNLPTLLVKPEDVADRYRVGYIYVSPEYFPVFRIPILHGRVFTEDEARAEAPVAVVSQSTARSLWPNREVLGRLVRTEVDVLRRQSARAPSYAAVRIIGIAADVTNGWAAQGADPTCFYFPSRNPARGLPGTFAQNGGTILLVRVNGDVSVARRDLNASLTAADPSAIEQIGTMDEILAEQRYPFRLSYWVSSTIAALALLLTLSGIYGVLSYVVTQRTKEIGIRVALGATARQAAGLVLKQSLRFAAIGSVLGAAAAAGASRLLASQLETFQAFDAVAFTAGVLLVLMATVGAAFLPSRRAARIQPLITLRHD